jgi:hypothetical protein
MNYLLFFVLGFVHGYVIYRLNTYVIPQKVPNLWCWHSVFGIACVVLFNYWFIWPQIVSSYYVLFTLFFTFLAALPGIYVFNFLQFNRYIGRFNNIKKFYESIIWQISRNGKFDETA